MRQSCTHFLAAIHLKVEIKEKSGNGQRKDKKVLYQQQMVLGEQNFKKFGSGSIWSQSGPSPSLITEYVKLILITHRAHIMSIFGNFKNMDALTQDVHVYSFTCVSQQYNSHLVLNKHCH